MTDATRQLVTRKVLGKCRPLPSSSFPSHTDFHTKWSSGTPPKCNHLFCVSLTIPKYFIKMYLQVFSYFDKRQTNKWINAGKNITSLAEVNMHVKKGLHLITSSGKDSEYTSLFLFCIKTVGLTLSRKKKWLHI